MRFGPSRPHASVAIAVATLLLAAVPGAPAAATAPIHETRLSNETTTTRYAEPNDRAPVLAQPAAGAPAVGRLHLDTEDGLPEIYLVLGQTTGENGDVWLNIRIPARPNGQTGWVREDDLGPLETVHTQLVVDTHKLRAALYRNGRKVFEAPVGVGKRGTPTPTGRFWIREGLANLGGGSYGPYAFGTSDYSSISDWPKGGVVGIHGTDQPHLVPGRPSHGCIRMRNAEILRLKRLMPLGTALLVV